MRPEVVALVTLGVMPAEGEASEDQVARYEQAIERLPQEATEQELGALLGLFPAAEGTFLGVAWSLLHYVERAPGWPVRELLDDRSWWVRLLRERAERGGQLPTL